LEEILPDLLDGSADRLREAIDRYVAASFATANSEVEEPDEMLAELLSLEEF
jgi:hypothetical protein